MNEYLLIFEKNPEHYAYPLSPLFYILAAVQLRFQSETERLARPKFTQGNQ